MKNKEKEPPGHIRMSYVPAGVLDEYGNSLPGIEVVGNATADIINKCGMVNVDGLTHFEPGQTKQEPESFYEFKECKDENEYIKDYLMSKDENSNAYQLAYDMSNDWAIEVPTWAMIEKAYLVGLAAAKLKTRINNERQEK